MKLKLYFLFHLIIIPHILFPQEVKRFDTTNSPLVPKELSSIAVDSSNTICIGTIKNQLYYYNGNWGIDSAIWDTSDIPVVSDIQVSPTGTIWTILTNSFGGRLYYHSGVTWNYINYDYGLYWPGNLSIENDSTLYYTLIASWPHNLGNDKIAIYSNDSIKTHYFPFVCGIASVSVDTLLIANALGISIFKVYDPASFHFDSLITINPQGWIPTRITKTKNKIYVFGEKLNQYKNGSYVNFPKVDSILSADTSNITSLKKEGNTLWIGTDEGCLIKFSDDIVTCKLSNYPIKDIVIDRDKNKWFITYDGLYVFNENKIVKVEQVPKIPSSYSLSQNYPNPFNPTTRIKYSLAESGNTNICIYDILGREIRKLVNEYEEVGNYEFEFNSDNLTNGIYFYRIVSGKYSETKKMVLLK